MINKMVMNKTAKIRSARSVTNATNAKGGRTMKGQYFSFDAIVASIIFILTFIALLTYWFSLKSGLESKDDEISREAARISDSMFTPMHLLTSYSLKKVNESALIILPNDEQALKKLFNSPYNIFISVVKQTNPDQVVLTRGNPPSPSSKNVAKVRRIFVMYDQFGMNETQAALDLYLYD